METIVCDIAKNRMEKEFNDTLQPLGLYVTSIRFEESEVVIELSCDENIVFCAS